MSQVSHYRERIAYEDLLLIWLDRVNQVMQFPINIKHRKELIFRSISIAEAVKSLYILLTPDLKEKVKQKLGNDPVSLLDYGYDYAYDMENDEIYYFQVILRDLIDERDREEKKIRQKYKEHKDKGKFYKELDSLYDKYTSKSIRLLRKRSSKVIEAIIDVLHENNLLLRAKDLYRGVVP